MTTICIAHDGDMRIGMPIRYRKLAGLDSGFMPFSLPIYGF